MKSDSSFSIRGEWEDVEDTTDWLQSGTNDERNRQNQPVKIVSNGERLGKRRLVGCNTLTIDKFTRKNFEKNKIHSQQASESAKCQNPKDKPKVPYTRNTEHRIKSFSVNRTTRKKGKVKKKTRKSEQGDTAKIQETLSKVFFQGKREEELENLNQESGTIQTLEIKRLDPRKKITVEIHIRGNSTSPHEEGGIICKSIIHKPLNNEKEDYNNREYELEEKAKNQSQEFSEHLIRTIKNTKPNATKEENKREPEQKCRSRSPNRKSQSRDYCIPCLKSPCRVGDGNASRKSLWKERDRSPSRKSPSKERDRSPSRESPSKERDTGRRQVSAQVLRVEYKVSKPTQNTRNRERPETEKKSGASSPRIKSRSKSNIQNTRTPSEQRVISEEKSQDFKSKDTPKKQYQNSERSHTSKDQRVQCQAQSSEKQLKEKDKTQMHLRCPKLKTEKSCRKMVSKTSSIIHGKRTQHNIRLLRQVRKPAVKDRAVNKKQERNPYLQVLKLPLQQGPKVLPKNGLGQIQACKSKSRNICCQTSESSYKKRDRESEKSIEILRTDLEEPRVTSSDPESKSESENVNSNNAKSKKSISIVDRVEKNNNSVKEHTEKESRCTQICERTQTHKSQPSSIDKQQRKKWEITPSKCNRVCIGYAHDQVDKPTPGRAIVKSITAKSESSEQCGTIYSRRSVQNLVRCQSLPPSSIGVRYNSHDMHTDPSSSFESFFRELEVISQLPDGRFSQWKVKNLGKKREPGSSVTGDKEQRKKNVNKKRQKKRSGMKLKCSRTRTLLHRITSSQTQTAAIEPENPEPQCSNTPYTSGHS